MRALLFIRDKRKKLEKIDFVGMLQLAMHGSTRATQKKMERWARDADVQISFSED